MNRRPNTSILAHPLLLGAVAILLLCYGTYLTYTAQTGLPFQPRYRLTVELPNGAQLAKQADVNMAGQRIGKVSSIAVRPGGDGRRPVAMIELSIDKRYAPLPADSTASVGIAGTLGAKYMEIVRGTSGTSLKDGATLPLRQARPFVQIDELFDVFTPQARQGIRDTLGTLGPGFAGRGPDLNAALGRFPTMLADLEPVARNLADPRTGLARFVRASSNLVAELAPEADTAAALFRDAATTFRAWSDVASPYFEETISATPPALDALVEESPRIDRLLTESTTLLASLRPAVAHLPSAAPVLADALAAGERTLPLTPGLDRRLEHLLGRVSSFARSSAVVAGVGRLALTFRSLAPLTAFLAPAQTTCTYLALFARNLASVFKEDVATGTMVRVGGVVVGVQDQNERGPSREIFRGPVAKAMGPVHSNPYPYTASPGQPEQCNAGHEPYVYNRPVIGNAPGVSSAETEEATLP